MKNHIKNIYCYSQLIELPYSMLFGIDYKDYLYLPDHNPKLRCKFFSNLFKTDSQKEFLDTLLDLEYYVYKIPSDKKIIIKDPIPKSCVLKLKGILHKRRFSINDLTILEVLDLAKNWNTSGQNQFSLPEEIECLFEIVSLFTSNKIRFQIVYGDKNRGRVSNTYPVPQIYLGKYPTNYIPTIVLAPPVIIKKKKKKK